MTETAALFLSIFVECSVALLLVWFARWPNRGMAFILIAPAAATLLTHPALWRAALWAYPKFGYWPSALVLEAAVILIEGVVILGITRLAPRQAILVSFVANSASVLAGWLVTV